jgi:hypothetical protein
MIEKYDQKIVEQKSSLKDSFSKAFELAMDDYDSQMKEFQSYLLDLF